MKAAGAAVAPSPARGRHRSGRRLVAFAFLAPAAVFLGLWIVYPAVRTVVRSLYGSDGETFVGLDNYERLFTNDVLVAAIRNNAVWVLVVPALVTALGLVFAVLTERVGWAVAFKTAVFMPMAISAFAAGVTWRLVYEKEPDRGALNAGIEAVRGIVADDGALPRATPSTEALEGSVETGYALTRPVRPGGVARLGLTAIRTANIPDGAEPARLPEPLRGGITGVVWRDFRPGGGTPGRVDPGEVGLPGVTVELRPVAGGNRISASTGPDGTFAFPAVAAGEYRVAVAAATFAQPFGGVSWLGQKLITPSIILAYTWIWAGFAMVVIGAGLAAIPRDLLEAARTDGATEWQVFRRVTVPLLMPVLSVVFVTMVIYVLKVFDIVIAIAPGSVQDDANVLALAMWRTAFSGANNFGLGSAIAVLIFVLVLPVLALNIRRFRREER